MSASIVVDAVNSLLDILVEVNWIVVHGSAFGSPLGPAGATGGARSELLTPLSPVIGSDPSIISFVGGMYLIQASAFD